MRYVAVVLVLLAAAALTTRFLQKAAGRQPDKSEAGRKSEANSESDSGGKSEAEDQPQTGGKAESGEQSPSDQDPKAGQSAKPDEEPLLLLDDDPPLLLDDDGEESGAGKPMADNSRCYHCHLDYVKEELGVIHAKANIGCADCHGNCDAHIADESWASGGNGTPPEKMYPREKINPLCFGCHAKAKLDKSEHEDLLAGTAKEKYCTDCHGDHRMPKRKCKWK